MNGRPEREYTGQLIPSLVDLVERIFEEHESVCDSCHRSPCHPDCDAAREAEHTAVEALENGNRSLL